MRRFLAYFIMMFTVLGCLIFNTQSVLENRTDSFEYGNGTQLVFGVSKRDNTLYSSTDYPESSLPASNLSDIDIENEVMDRLDSAGVRYADVQVINGNKDNVGYQVKVNLSPLSSTELSNVKEILTISGTLSVSTIGDTKTMYAEASQFFSSDTIAEITYSGTTPYPTLNITSTDDFDTMKKAAEEAAGTTDSGSSDNKNAIRHNADDTTTDTDDTTKKTLYLWYNKTTDDTYDKAFGTNDTIVQEEVKNKVIAKLSTDNWDSDNKQLTITSDMDGNAFTISTARAFVTMLNAPDYGFDFTYLYSNTTDPVFGTSGLSKTYLALGISLLAICILLVVFYGLSGLTASVSMLISVFVSFGLFSLVGFELSTGALIGLFVIMALSVLVSSNYFERVKLELKKGRDPEKANREGYHKAFFTGVDVSAVSLLASLFSFLVASGSLKTFFGMIMVGTVFTWALTNYLDKWMTFWLVKDCSKDSKVPFFNFAFLKNKELKPKKFVSSDKKSNSNKLMLGISCFTGLLLALALPLTGTLINGYSIFNNSGTYADTYSLNITFGFINQSYDKLSTTEKYLQYIEDIGSQNSTASFVATSSEKTSTSDTTFVYYPDSAYVNVIEKTNADGQTYYMNYFTVTVDRNLDTLIIEDDNTVMNSIDYAVLGQDITSDNVIICPGDDPNFISDDYEIGCYNTIAANLSHNTNNFFLVIFLLSVFATIYTLIRYGLNLALTQLAAGTLLSGLAVGLLSATRLPFDSYTAFGLLAAVFLLNLIMIPLLNRNKERLKEEGIKKTATHEQRALIENESTAKSLPVVISPLITVLVPTLSLFFINPSLESVTISLIVLLVLTMVVVLFFALPFYYYLCTHISFHRVTDFFTNKHSQKTQEKAQKEESRNKNGIEYVDADSPHETIIPGMNDFLK